MNRYSNKLENLKMAFFDVDNTLLCLKMYDDNGNRIIGVAHPDDWLRYNIVNNAYVNCKDLRTDRMQQFIRVQ